MRIFKTRWLVRFARRERVSNSSLTEAIARAEAGLIDADLGGGLIKQRVARSGKGRSGGYRMLVAYRMGDRAVFIFGLRRMIATTSVLPNWKHGAKWRLTGSPLMMTVLRKHYWIAL